MLRFAPLFLAAVIICGLLLTRLAQAPEGQELIGKPAPEWEVTDWIHSEPLQLKNIRGKVVLVRFWTTPDCPFCAASAPSLNEFHKKYHAQGLEVIGFYHHKSLSPLNPQDVKKYADRFGFQFPVAIDDEWKTLKRWWLEGRERDWTSVSFLIDKQGIIRSIHPGGQYVKGDPEYAKLQEMIEKLLKE